MSSADDFSRMFADFLGVFGAFDEMSIDDRAQLYALTKASLGGVVSEMTERRAQAAAAQVPPTPADDKRDAAALSSLEAVIGEKMRQHGFTRNIFLRFDQAKCGRLTAREFQTAVARIGIEVSDREVELFVRKYDNGVGATNTHVHYDAFLANTVGGHELTSSSQLAHSQALVGRDVHDHAAVSHRMSALGDHEAVHIDKALQNLRDKLYHKSKSVYRLFKEWADVDNSAASGDGADVNGSAQMTATPAEASMSINNFARHIRTFNFGEDDEELFVRLAEQCSRRRRGYLTYHEFLAFFLGKTAGQVTRVDVDANGEPVAFDTSLALFIDVLLKMGHQNLRKQFKSLDTDNDGMVSVEQLADYVCEWGLNKSVTDGAPFRAMLAAFGRKTPGFLHYSEFIAFCNQRQQVTRAEPRPPPEVLPATTTASEALQRIRTRVRDTSMSLLSLFEVYDTRGSGTLGEADFFHAMVDLGVELPASVIRAFYDACECRGVGVGDDDAKQLVYAEFARLVQFPGRHHLHAHFTSVAAAAAAAAGETGAAGGDGAVGEHTKPNNGIGAGGVRPAPGGDSSVPLGSYVEREQEPPVRSEKRHVTRSGAADDAHFHIAGKGMTTVAPPLRDTQTFKSTLQIGGPPLTAEERAALPQPRALMRAVHAPGGSSTLSLRDDVRDDAASTTTAVLSDTGRETYTFGEGTDPAAAAADAAEQRARNKRYACSDVTGADHLDVGVTPVKSAETTRRPLAGALQGAGGQSVFEDGFVVGATHKPLTRVSQPAGGKSSIVLGGDGGAGDGAPVPLLRGGRAHVQPVVHVNDGGVNTVGGVASVDAAAAVQDAAAAEAAAAAAAASQEHEDAASPPTTADIDAAMVSLSEEIYRNGKLRATYLNMRGGADGLTLELLADGMRKMLKTARPPFRTACIRPVFDTFDSDGDGAITYSEFVKFLSHQR